MKKALILSGIYWNEPLQRHQQFAFYLSRMGYEVIFLEKITSSKFTFKKFRNVLLRKLFNRAEYSKRVMVNDLNEQIVPVNVGFVNPGNGFFKIINKRKIKKFICEYGNKYDIVINYLPINTTRMILDLIEYKSLIYDCVRNFTDWGEYYKSVVDEQEKLIMRSAKIFTDSFFLTNKMLNYKKPVVQFLPIANNCWLSGCQKREVYQIKNIVYFGSVENHINITILKKLVEKGMILHIWGVVGVTLDFEYINHGYQSDLKKLSKEITAIGDAIILPYQGMMDGVIPAKLLQCLSTGLPVFVSDFYDSRCMEEYLYLYDDIDDLLTKIKKFELCKHKEKQKKAEILVKGLTEDEQFRQFKNNIK